MKLCIAAREPIVPAELLCPECGKPILRAQATITSAGVRKHLWCLDADREMSEDYPPLPPRRAK